MLNFVRKLFDHNERQLKKLSGHVAEVNDLEPEVRAMDDEVLRAQTGIFRGELERGADLDALLPRAFATVREAARRILGERHYDEQVMGAIVLHRGDICEMKTGEGKTLAATMPVYLNALTGRGVHVITVNDYLAERDAEWMGQIYRFLGMDVGTIVPGLDSAERRASYRCDVTYGTNNEFGFDYLRDNMAVSPDRVVQRPLHYAIVDEVDSVLVDEARTPLIISGMPRKSSDVYRTFAHIGRSLKPEVHYTVDEKASTAVPTEEGVAEVEERLGIDNLFEPEHIEYSHSLRQSLKAKSLMKRDRDYIVRDDQVIIVDQFTGRLMPGRRYSNGLHQAIEAKEGVQIREETQTLASITFQNYFRMYDKLAGMTGTAATEADEFHEIYNLEVVVIPTHEPMIREDLPDAVYKSEEGKTGAVVEDIVLRNQHGQPILVGTTSVDKSEEFSRRLKQRGISHEVLNAKHHEREAEIIAKAGEQGRVTIATNMAGRGTDIVLGPGVTDLGGLHVIASERHESRRIDNQLRGRSGRQGDPGSSQFYVSLEDDLMRLFAGEAVDGILEKLGFTEEERLEHPMLSRAIENAQRKVEARNFDIRKRLLEYDDVLNEQRRIIYEQRGRVLRGDSVSEEILDMLDDLLEHKVQSYTSEGRYPETWNLQGLTEDLEMNLLPPRRIDVESLTDKAEEGGREEMVDHLCRVGRAVYHAKKKEVGARALERVERLILLRVVDNKWMDYLAAVDELRQGISLRAYGQRDPLTEYRRETHHMFSELIRAIKEDAVKYVFKVDIEKKPSKELSASAPIVTEARGSGESGTAVARPHREAVGSASSGSSTGAAKSKKPYQRKKPKVGRNDPCPCGSGKKYKFCCRDRD